MEIFYLSFGLLQLQEKKLILLISLNFINKSFHHILASHSISGESVYQYLNKFDLKGSCCSKGQPDQRLLLWQE